MKSMFRIFILLSLLSLTFCLHLSSNEVSRRRKRAKVPENGTCDEEQKTNVCNKGLKCFPLISPAPEGIDKGFFTDWKCKQEKYKVPVGGYCMFQTFGSQCQRDSTTYATCKHRKIDGVKFRSKVGICKVKGANPILPAPALARSQSIKTTPQSIKTTPILDVPEADSLDESEITYVNDAFDEVQQLMEDKDAFAAGYIILQYFVDEDEIKSEGIKKIMKKYLEYMRSQGRKCEDIEAELDLQGIHVVDTWTNAERSKYLWMVNNNYIKGLRGSYDKAAKIRGLADTTSGTASKIMGEFASNAEIAGGFIKTLVDLAVQTIVDKQLTNAMLAASSYTPSSGDGSSPAKAKAIFIKSGDRIALGEGFGMIPRNSICKELKVDAGIKYMTGAHKTT